jgi:hypothetical protein
MPDSEFSASLRAISADRPIKLAACRSLCGDLTLYRPTLATRLPVLPDRATFLRAADARPSAWQLLALWREPQLLGPEFMLWPVLLPQQPLLMLIHHVAEDAFC